MKSVRMSIPKEGVVYSLQGKVVGKLIYPGRDMMIEFPLFETKPMVPKSGSSITKNNTTTSSVYVSSPHPQASSPVKKPTRPISAPIQRPKKC